MKRKEKKNEIEIISTVETESLKLVESVKDTVSEMEDSFFPALLNKSGIKEMESEVNAVRESFRRTRRNIAHSYEAMFEVSDELSGRWHDIRRGKRLVPANAVVDEEEKRKNHFSRGVNAYKILWIFYIGSFAGVIIEMLWCYLRKGHFESRQGLIYGPFNILYGFGAVALSYFLYRFRNHSDWVSYLGGFVIGTVLEYICSWGQEFTLGVRAWDYSNLPFNINGRVCLYYSLMWGLLGVLWIKRIYPLLSFLVLRIPDKIGKILTWVILVFFIFNITASGFVMARWTMRTSGVEASSAVSRYIDRHYPDERLEKIFPNWSFSVNKE